MNNVVLSLCKRYKVKILFEPLSYAECDFHNTLNEASNLVTRIDSSYFGLMADVSHMFNNKEPIESLESNMNSIEQVHISNTNRELPETEFDSYIEKGLNILKKTKYSKRISFETNDGNIVN